MRSWKENFGSFFTNSCAWDSKKTIEIIRKDGMTGEEMVRQAIALAKQYNCSIVKPVEYVPEIVGGKVNFTVECHTLTYRYFYEYGKTYTLHGSEVRECDLQKYEAKFGTRRCIHKGYKKQFWFTDNWNGQVLYYPSLRKARKAASRQTGNVCYVYETFPYGQHSRIVCKAPASGFTPP